MACPYCQQIQYKYYNVWYVSNSPIMHYQSSRRWGIYFISSIIDHNDGRDYTK